MSSPTQKIAATGYPRDDKAAARVAIGSLRFERRAGAHRAQVGVIGVRPPRSGELESIADGGRLAGTACRRLRRWRSAAARAAIHVVVRPAPWLDIRQAGLRHVEAQPVREILSRQHCDAI